MGLNKADALMKAINTWPKFGVDERGRIVPWNEGYEPYIHLRDAVIAITGMPTIEPERTKGNWVGIDDEPCDEWECDRCGFIYDGSPPPNFCENCGADMRGENDDIPDDIPKNGKWIEYDNSHCECPFCHEEWSYFDNEVEYFNYCPNCGARMES